MSVLDYERVDRCPVLDNLIVHRPLGTQGARERHWTQFELGAGGLPRSMTTIAVNACRQLSIGRKVDRVLGRIVRCHRPIVASLKLHQLPRGPLQRAPSWRCRLTLEDSKRLAGCAVEFEPAFGDAPVAGALQDVLKATRNLVGIADTRHPRYGE